MLAHYWLFVQSFSKLIENVQNYLIIQANFPKMLFSRKKAIVRLKSEQAEFLENNTQSRKKNFVLFTKIILHIICIKLKKKLENTFSFWYRKNRSSLARVRALPGIEVLKKSQLGDHFEKLN